jgi:hypothetical protein
VAVTPCQLRRRLSSGIGRTRVCVVQTQQFHLQRGYICATPSHLQLLSFLGGNVQRPRTGLLEVGVSTLCNQSQRRFHVCCSHTTPQLPIPIRLSVGRLTRGEHEMRVFGADEVGLDWVQGVTATMPLLEFFFLNAFPIQKHVHNQSEMASPWCRLAIDALFVTGRCDTFHQRMLPHIVRPVCAQRVHQRQLIRMPHSASKRSNVRNVSA